MIAVTSLLEQHIIEDFRPKYNLQPENFNVKEIGEILCGENWELALHPFSREFLENVAFNGLTSMRAIIWLQLKSLES